MSKTLVSEFNLELSLPGDRVLLPRLRSRVAASSTMDDNIEDVPLSPIAMPPARATRDHARKLSIDEPSRECDSGSVGVAFPGRGR